jgi:hypothetical protein
MTEQEKLRAAINEAFLSGTGHGIDVCGDSAPDYRYIQTKEQRLEELFKKYLKE